MQPIRSQNSPLTYLLTWLELISFRLRSSSTLKPSMLTIPATFVSSATKFAQPETLTANTSVCIDKSVHFQFFFANLFVTQYIFPKRIYNFDTLWTRIFCHNFEKGRGWGVDFSGSIHPSYTNFIGNDGIVNSIRYFRKVLISQIWQGEDPICPLQNNRLILLIMNYAVNSIIRW